MPEDGRKLRFGGKTPNSPLQFLSPRVRSSESKEKDRGVAIIIQNLSDELSHVHFQQSPKVIYSALTEI